MTKIVDCAGKEILKIKTISYDYLHELILENIEKNNIQVSPALAKFIEEINFYDLDIIDYLTNKEDILLYAQLVKHAVDTKERSTYPFSSGAEAIFRIFYYQLKIYALQEKQDKPNGTQIHITCNRRGIIKEVIALPAGLCTRFYTSIKNTFDPNIVMLPASELAFIEQLAPPYTQKRTVEISAYITSRIDALGLAQLVHHVIDKMKKESPGLTETEEAQLSILLWWFFLYEHNLINFDEHGNRRGFPKSIK